MGGLRPELGPGTFVVPDQLIDRTSGRAQTFYDSGAVHVSFADPYCPAGRATVLRTGARVRPADGGTMDTIAEAYVKLVLALGQHDPDYVDAYYGPSEWKASAQSGKAGLEAIGAQGQ